MGWYLLAIWYYDHSFILYYIFHLKKEKLLLLLFAYRCVLIKAINAGERVRHLFVSEKTNAGEV